MPSRPRWRRFDLADVKPAADQPGPTGVAAASFTFDGLSVDLRLFARDNADWLAAIAAAGKDAAEASQRRPTAVAAWAAVTDRAKLCHPARDSSSPPKDGDAGDAPASPCLGICLMDPASRMCRGCLRTIDEIRAWYEASAAQKRAILARLDARRRENGKR